MTACLQIDFEAAEGALLRIIGLVERRGYRVRELSLTEHSAHSSLSLLIAARDDQRRPDVLARQISNLVDVISITLTPDRPMVPA